MSSFKDPAILMVSGEYSFTVIDGFSYYTDMFGDREIISVPDGFCTDVASSPKILWSIIPSIGLYTKAAIMHDYLYSSGKYDRKSCDKMFLEAMKILGVVKVKRELMYLAVRIFGKNKFKK